MHARAGRMGVPVDLAGVEPAIIMARTMPKIYQFIRCFLKWILRARFLAHKIREGILDPCDP